MSRLAVLLAPARGAEDVRSTLHDWIAANLVHEVLWVETPWVSEVDAQALRLGAQGVSGTTLRTAIADARGVDEIQLCVLVPVSKAIEPAPAEVEHLVLQLLGSGAGNPLRVRISFPRGVTAGSSAVVAREFWHNLVIIAEDREGPSSGAIPHARTDTPEYGMHVAANIAGVLGLWTHVSSAAVGGAPQPGQTARLTASYYRRLTAAASENSLRAAVLSTAGGLPRPRRYGAAAVYIDDVKSASLAMARALWDRHRALFEGPRQRASEVPSEAVGVRKAIAMFFSYMGAAIRNAPRAWLERFKLGLASSAAGVLQNVIFGSTGSSYEIVVKGVTRDGRPASLLQLNRAAQELERAADEEGGSAHHEGIADFSGLWRDFCGGALTLADGGDRDAGMPAIHVGSDVGVIRSVESIAPTDASAFDGLGGQLGAAVPVGRVQAYDIVTITSVERQLAHQRDNPDLERDTAHALEALRSWRVRNGDAYTTCIGLAMANRMHYVQNEIAATSQVLAAASNADLSAHESRQPSLARRLLIMLLVVLGVVAAAVVVAVLGVVSLLLGILIAVVVLIGGFIAMVRTFWVGQRDLFHLLHRREQAEKDVEVARHNLRQAARDLRRLTDAYGQFLVWSRVLGVVMSQPFGPPTAAVTDAVDLQPPLPRSTKIGTVELEPAVLAQLADDIRRDVFAAGWLTMPWRAVIDSAAALVGPGFTDAPEAPNAIYSQPSSGPGAVPSFLDTWSERVARDGIASSGADELWQQILESFGKERANYAQQLMSSIVTVGQPGPSDLASFLAGVDGTNTTTARFLDASLLRPNAASGDESQVAISVPRSDVFGLSRIALLTDLSKPIRAGNFALTDTTSEVVEQRSYLPPALPAYGESSPAAADGQATPPAPAQFRPPPMPGGSDVPSEPAPPPPAPPADPFADPQESSEPADRPRPSPRPGWTFGPSSENG